MELDMHVLVFDDILQYFEVLVLFICVFVN